MDTNIDNRWAHILQLGILALNAVSVVGVSISIYATIENIRRSYVTREFLSGIQAIVWYLCQNIRVCTLFLALLAGSMSAQGRLFPDNSKVILFSLVADFAICLTIIILLNFSCNGILLLAFSNIVLYAKNRGSGYFPAVVTIGSSVLTDYKLPSIFYRLYSIQDHISFYNASAQQYLLSCYSILVSLNVIMLMVYYMSIINQQQGNLDEIHTLNEQLQDVNEQFQEYSVMTEKMAEAQERNRLTREVYDTLGHTLTEITVGIDACLTTIGTPSQQTKDQLELISKVTRGGIKGIRRSVSQLRPDALERFSLEYAISKMVSDMNTVSGARVYLDYQIENLRFDGDEGDAIYRAIREGITNALRHDHASQIWITIGREDTDVLLQIRDNRIGCKEIKNGFGTRHVKERIKMLNDVVTFDGNDGFTINTRIPVR